MFMGLVSLTINVLYVLLYSFYSVYKLTKLEFDRDSLFIKFLSIKISWV